ncbi:hypothetical protein Tsubulata_021488 [Turnera subulata]|uniref:Uncharacterized protein n=1 Tax=Turnera subulata TaxID=218843 RepID=A0A9Q0F220_9ROSI|nr:hypothetical protein Tsubulata_021488 [Turnera subulata]
MRIVGHDMSACHSGETALPVADNSTAAQVTTATPAATGTRDCQPRREWMVAAPHQCRPRSGFVQQKRVHGPDKETLPRKETISSGSAGTGGPSGSRFDVLQDYVTVSRPASTSNNHASMSSVKPSDKGKAIAKSMRIPLR